MTLRYSKSTPLTTLHIKITLMDSIGWRPDSNNNINQNNSKDSNTFTSTLKLIIFNFKQLKNNSKNL